MKQYIVDAFTNKPFSGNPAAVCVMDKWPSEEFMKNLAMENNLSETAFIVKEEQGYHLRWFTPGSEVELCGHATLASSFVILNYVEPGKDIVEFHTLSGKLTVRKKDNLYEMDFPTYEQKEIPVTDEVRGLMKTKRKGNNWTAYYDPDTNRYFAEIMYTSREGREEYDYEITKEIYDRLGSFSDDVENERLIKTAKMSYSFENTMYGTLGPERTVWDEEANEAMKETVKKNS